MWLRPKCALPNWPTFWSMPWRTAHRSISWRDFLTTRPRAFWSNQLPGIASGEKILFVGDDGEKLLATVLLMFAPQPNAPHRAEIGKMLVHSSMQRQGLGRRLLETAEQAARDSGRTLLILDTATGSAGERLYRKTGWTELGTMPGHSFTPDGRLAPATFFYKALRLTIRPRGGRRWRRNARHSAR